MKQPPGLVAVAVALWTVAALAEPRAVEVKNFPGDAPCDLFRRDEKGTWHLRDDVVVLTTAVPGTRITGQLRLTKWSRSAATADAKSLEARCGSN